MLRLWAGAVVLLVLASSCSEGSPLAGFRDSEPGEVIAYRIVISQERTAKGLGDPKTLRSKVRLDIEEESQEDGYTLIVRAAKGTGEPSQVGAAQRLVGRRIDVQPDPEQNAYDVALFAGSQDLAAADVGILHALFAPMIPEPRSESGTSWRGRPPEVRVPWAQEPLRFTLDHEITGDERIRELDAARVRSRALTNVRFRLPLVVESPSADGGDPSDDLIVNQLFDQLFGDIDNPVEGVAAAIAAIPLAVVAPFLALGEALGSFFGSGDSDSEAPEIPAVDLAGPLTLTSDTAVWRADGRVLEADATGTTKLSGTMPELPGRAAELSGTPLTLTTKWTIVRRMTSPWPEPRAIPGRELVLLLAALLAVVAGAIAATLRTRRARRDVAKPVRDSVSKPRPREPELADA